MLSPKCGTNRPDLPEAGGSTPSKPMASVSPAMQAWMDAFVRGSWAIFWVNCSMGLAGRLLTPETPRAVAIGLSALLTAICAPLWWWMLKGLRCFSAGWRTWFLWMAAAQIARGILLLLGVFTLPLELPVWMAVVEVIGISWAAYTWQFLLDPKMAKGFHSPARTARRVTKALAMRMDSFVQGYWSFFWGTWLVGLLMPAFWPERSKVDFGRLFLAAVFSPVISAPVHWWMLQGLRSFSRGWRTWFLVLSVLRILSGTGLLLVSTVSAGIAEVIAVSWAVYTYRFLLAPEIREGFQMRTSRPRTGTDPPTGSAPVPDTVDTSCARAPFDVSRVTEADYKHMCQYLARHDDLPEEELERLNEQIVSFFAHRLEWYEGNPPADTMKLLATVAGWYEYAHARET